ncbi:MAG: hypothetical protein AVDCRST_MAG44-1553 [uncultured Sphingomonas sp.]|uniref:Uncharacterized protein n=1 Tax=uncultured Sphingomonas sp. TaxID=158754 RepID=A0A6J4T571_9SPHN|nr:MAG: hypothetical protein AVDCRST_MAG44-1553 [uncultured Sphingomonas sp.]
MMALMKIAAGGVAAAALVSAAPAAAQYYPGYGYGGNVVGQVINQVLGGGYGGGYAGGYGGGYAGGYGGGYGVNQQAVVGQCVNAVQARLQSNYGYGGGYGGYGGYNGYAGGGARVLGISRVEPRSRGGITVRGVANSGRSAGYGYANNNIDLTFKCSTDYRGFITDIDVDRAQQNYGYNYNNGYSNGYVPNDPYAAYGYRRY